MKKNILIIGNYPPPYGGVPNHIERLTEYLLDKGWTCHVLSGGTSGYIQKNRLFVYKPTFTRKLLSIWTFKANKTFKDWLNGDGKFKGTPSLWRRYIIYANIGENIVRKYNIGLVVSYNLMSYGPVGAYLSSKYSIPHISNVFGEIYKYSWLIENKYFYRKVLTESTKILSCSNHCGKSVDLLGDSLNVQSITYGINVEHFSPEGETIDRLEIGDDLVVLFVGRISREMGVDCFLASANIVASKVPNIRFVIVGQAGDFLEETLQKCLPSNGKYSVVINASYDDLPKYYRKAKVVVVPTKGDRTCSSLAAMEAMAARRPVVAFAIGGIPEIIRHGETGLLIPPEDTMLLANAIELLLNDSGLSEKLAANGHLEAISNFDERRVNEYMESIYRKLVE